MKVKVTKTRGTTGNQRNYGLVTGSIWNYEDKPTSNNVGTTLSAVPRDEATIEAERGETVVGDLDNDGMVEHAKIGGKRHPQGGTPLNVPDGSFVFSDYRGLLIKNTDVLKNIFNMNSSKAVTPAKVAQRYEINKFKNMLNDPFIDPIDRKTAQLMIDNNMRKLGQLALIQEGMKGFPDGIPAIAMPLMGSDMGQQGGQQKMKKGGIVSYKKGGLARYQGPKKSQVDLSGYNDMRQIPINLKAPDQDPNTWNPDWNNLPDWLEDIDQDGMVTPQDLQMYQQMNEELDRNRLLNQAKADAMGNFGGVRDNTNLMSPQRYTGPLYTDITLPNGQVLSAQDQIAIDNNSSSDSGGSLYETPDYQNPDSWKYYAHELGDVVTNPGSYLMYAMTPGDQGRFGTYLQNNTNPVGDVLDFGVAAETGFLPWLGAEFGKKKIEQQAAEKATADEIYAAYAAQGLPAPTEQEIKEYQAGIGGGARMVTYVLGAGLLTGLTHKLGVSQGWWRKNPLAKGWATGRPYLERKLRQRMARFPEMYEYGKRELRKLSPKNLGEKGYWYADEIYRPVREQNRLQTLEPDFAILASKGRTSPSTWSNYFNRQVKQKGVKDKVIQEVPYANWDSYWGRGGRMSRIWDKVKGPVGKTAGVGVPLGAAFWYGYNKENEEEAKKIPEKGTENATNKNTNKTTVKIPDDKVKEIENYFYTQTGNKQGLWSQLSDEEKQSWMKDYEKNKDDVQVKVSNEADDVKEEEKKETKKDTTSTTKVRVGLPSGKVNAKEDEEFEDLGTTRDTTGTYLRVNKKKFGGMLDHYDGENKSQVYTGSNTTIDRPESAIPTDWSGLSDYDILYAPEGQTGELPNQSYNQTLGYYTTKRNGKVQKVDLEDFYKRQNNILSGYEGGLDNWKTQALSRDPATRKKAVGWFQKEYDNWRESVGLPRYFFGQSGNNAYGYDDLLGQYTSAAPGIVKKMKEEQKKKEEEKKTIEEKKDETELTAPNWQKSQRSGYPRPRRADLLGELGAAMQEIRRYPSMYSPVNNTPTETIYNRFDPQTIMGAYTTKLQNAGTGPDSSRPVEDVTGKALEAIAQGQANNDVQTNNPRFMDMSARNQQATLQTNLYNAAEDIRFQDDVSNKWQDYLDNYNKIMANVFNKKISTVSNQEKLAYLKALIPHANLDFDQTPTANATLNSITDEPIATATGGSDNFSALHQNAYNYFIKQGLSTQDAAKQAVEYVKAQLAYDKMYRGTAMSPFNIPS